MSSQEAPIRKREYLTPRNILGQFILSARNFAGLGIPVMSSLEGKLSELKSFSLTMTENMTYKQVFSFFFFFLPDLAGYRVGRRFDDFVLGPCKERTNGGAETVRGWVRGGRRLEKA